MTIRFKSCPKCSGYVRVDRDQYGWYEQCIQCGYVRDLEPITMTPEKNSPEKGESWLEGSTELKPITPFSLSPELGHK